MATSTSAGGAASSASWRSARWAVALAVLVSGALPAPAQVTLGGPLPGPLPLFPADNWWNVDVAAAPVDPRSAAFIAWIGNDALHPDFGGDAGPRRDLRHSVHRRAGQRSRSSRWTSCSTATRATPARRGGRPAIRFRTQARTQPKWIEGGTAGGGDDGDHHMLIVDRDRRLLFELYQAHWTGAWLGSRSRARSSRSTANTRRPEGWTSADAAGLAILPGLVRYDEVYESSAPIRHAFRVTLRGSNGYVFPGFPRRRGQSRARRRWARACGSRRPRTSPDSRRRCARSSRP